MTAIPCGRKNPSNAATQSHSATAPLAAIEEMVFRFSTATTKNNARSHRPSSRRSALAGLVLMGGPPLLFAVISESFVQP